MSDPISPERIAKKPAPLTILFRGSPIGANLFKLRKLLIFKKYLHFLRYEATFVTGRQALFEFIWFLLTNILWIIGGIFGVIFAWIVLVVVRDSYAKPPTEEEREPQLRDLKKMQAEQAFAQAKKAARQFDWTYGSRNNALKCPHCDEKGSVFSKSVNPRKGISGGKAVGAVFTGGVSLIATGISRREKMTQAHCDICDSTWQF